ncbi:amidohydrolase family protein [bacterium]|nr:amidohydrolase family protein [bacterium]
MIIDFHTHLLPADYLTDDLANYFKSRKIWDSQFSMLTSDCLLKIMDDNNIAASVVLSLALTPDMKNSEISRVNKYVSEQVYKNKDRLLGFFTLNPFFGDESMQVLESSIKDLGLLGLKIHPSFQEICPDDKTLYPFYKKMQDYGLPVLFHTGSIGIIPFKDSFSNPSHIDAVASDFPQLTIIIGHSGKIWHDETAMLLRKHKNVFADISTNIGRDSFSSEHPMAWLLYKFKSYAGCMDRLIFGSDYPFYMQDETINCLHKAVKLLNEKYNNFITDEDIEKILYKNALNLLNKIKDKKMSEY